MDPVFYERNQAIAAQCRGVLPTFGIYPWEAHHYADDRWLPDRYLRLLAELTA